MKFRVVIILLLISFLSSNACQDTNNSHLAEGGIDGSGITTGRISGFGSLIVNGITFDVSNAVFTRDNRQVIEQSDFSLGEVVFIKGATDLENRTGVANSVSFANLLEGPVSQKPPLKASSLQVLGQTVNVTDLTIPHGFLLISDLEPADVIEVSGFYNESGDIQATSIRLNTSDVSFFEIKGNISNLDQVTKTFTLNRLIVNYANADITLKNNELSDGLFVEITAQVVLNDTLFARTISLIEPVRYVANSQFEVEGLITRFNSIFDFDLNNIPITTTPYTIFKDGVAADLGINVLIEVEGTVDKGGNLVASSVELEQAVNLPKIEATLDSISLPDRTLVLLGKTVRTDLSTILFDESNQKAVPLTLAMLRVGENIDAKVQPLADGTFLAILLSREELEDDFSIKGIIENIDNTDGSFSLLDIEIVVDENTKYFDANRTLINQATFMSTIVENITVVETEGVAVGSSSILAKTVIAD